MNLINLIGDRQIMSIEFLNDSTLWVSLSFIIFVCIILKPILTQISGSLEKKSMI